VPKVFPVRGQKIKGNEARLRTAQKEIVELRLALRQPLADCVSTHLWPTF